MNAGRAFVAGMLGGALVSLLLWSAQDGFAVPVSLAVFFGTLVGLEPFATSTALVGQAMFLALAGGIGVLYAWGFERLTHLADVRVGAVFGLVHAAVAGLLLPVVSLVHPLIPETLAPVGPYMIGLGAEGVSAFIFLHLLYGGTVGSIYAPAISRRRMTTAM